MTARLTGHPAWCGGLLVLLATLVYNVNMREITSQDTFPTRFLPVAVLTEHRLDLDSVFRDYPPDRPLPYWIQHVHGHYRSSYPVLPALLAVPVYALPVVFRGGDSWPLVNALAKLAGALMAALSVLFVYLAARQLASGEVALGIALTYAFATSTWSVASQGLWGHGPAELFLAAALYGIVRTGTPRRSLAWVGLATGLMLASRPTTAVIAAGLLAYACVRDPRAGALGLALCGLVTAAVLAYNVRAFGALEGGYAWMNANHPAFHGVAGEWSTPLARGLLGILVSPSRGLFVYSPVLVFAVVGPVLAWHHPRRGLFAVVTAGLTASLLIMGKYSVWWGGHAFGPRLLTDFLPLFAMLLVPVWPWFYRSRVIRTAFLALLTVSISVQAIGAFCYPSPRSVEWNTTPRDVDVAHDRLWDWRDPQLLRLLRNGPRPMGFVTPE